MPIPLNELDFAQALTVAEAAAVLLGQKVADQAGDRVPGAILVHNPQLALAALQEAARASGHPRIRGAARHALSAFFGVDVEAHPYLLTAAHPRPPAPRAVGALRRAG